MCLLVDVAPSRFPVHQWMALYPQTYRQHQVDTVNSILKNEEEKVEDMKLGEMCVGQSWKIG